MLETCQKYFTSTLKIKILYFLFIVFIFLKQYYLFEIDNDVFDNRSQFCTRHCVSLA